MKSLVDSTKEKLASIKCSHCEGPKKPSKPFCGMCVIALPDKIRIPLYSSMSDVKKAEIFDEAEQWLNCESEIPKGLKKWKS